MDRKAARSKKKNLIKRLMDLDSLLVAFSGGVDSSFLLAVAHEALGENVVAVTAESIIHPVVERDEAIAFVKERGIRHRVFASEEMGLPDFLANSPDRCYHCKKMLVQALFKIAGEEGVKTVAHGANADDSLDYRPGFRAAQDAGVISPLLDARLNKQEIRYLSKDMGLSTWDKPAMACLASRIPYGEPITKKKLRMVEDAEAYLRKKGLGQLRVRYHGTVARIELEASQITKIAAPDIRKNIVEKFRQIGFLHVTLDLEGYIQGSMNRALKNGPLEGAIE